MLTLIACLLQAPTPAPAPSKKGLQVQMTDDALELGVRHAALNVVLSGLIDPARSAAHPSWTLDGVRYAFEPAALAPLDRDIRALSERGVSVTVILLNAATGEPERDRALLHPRYDPAAPNRLSAFTVDDEFQRGWLRATLQFLAERWSGGAHGRVDNWILGNEVNSHWWWSNQGRATLEDVARDYEAALRVAHEALTARAPHARVFVSLEHHWSTRHAAADEHQGFGARPFLERLNELSKARGDFPWHVAFHPYPENLFEPRTWLDESALDELDSPRITFKNLEQLPRFLQQEELRVGGRARSVILSEQGFHTPDGPDGEALQAAAFCYAWKKVAALDGIEAFILHRHVDHGHEGGLRLGLWSRRLDVPSPCEPLARKRIWEVFRAAGTPDEERAFAFALPLIGPKSWADALRGSRTR